MKRESLRTSIPSHHFQSRSGILKHTDGTYSHSGKIDYQRFFLRNWILGNFLVLWNFEAGRSTSGLRFVWDQPILRSQWIGSKKLRQQSQWTNFWNRDRFDFPDFDMFDAMIASALKKLGDKHVHFRRRVSVEEQRVQKHDRFLRGRQIAYMIHEYVRATRAYETVQGIPDFVRFKFTEWRRLKISTLDGSSIIISEWIAFTCDLARFVQWVNCFQMWSWKICTSQNYRILFSFRLSWLCTIKKLLETMDKHIIYDWRRL